jgi:hypothetical protein
VGYRRGSVMPPLRRRYDRGFEPAGWVYGPDPLAVRPSGLVPVTWEGLALNTGDQPNGLCLVVEDVEGWADSPPLDGNDALRSIADGAAWGPKTLGPRTVTIHGAATGPRAELIGFRDQLTARAAGRVPGELAIGDNLDRTLTADVRAGTERYRHEWLGPAAFRYQVVLTAADPLLYEATWQTVVLRTLVEGEATGRDYPREYPWHYAVAYLPNTAQLANAGNADAPVWALYEGPLGESRLTSEGGGLVYLAPLTGGQQIRVNTSTLAAEAAGGLGRASYILPGSRPATLPPVGGSRFHLYAIGAGSVTLAWRSAWA